MQETNQAKTNIESNLVAGFMKLFEEKKTEVKQKFWSNLQERWNHGFDATDFKFEELFNFNKTKEEDGKNPSKQ